MKRRSKLTSPLKFTTDEIRAMDLNAEAGRIIDELEAIVWTGDDRGAAAAASTLLSMTDRSCHALERMHTKPVAAKASDRELAPIMRARSIAQMEAAHRVTYPVMIRSASNGVEIPAWAARLKLIPEPLDPSTTAVPGREELKRYLRAFLRTLQDPADVFNVLDDDEEGAARAIASAKTKDLKEYRKAVKREFVAWMQRRYASIVENPKTPLGAEVALKLNNSRRMKGTWAAFGEIVKDYMRVVRAR